MWEHFSCDVSKTSSLVCFIKHSAAIDAAALPACSPRLPRAPTLLCNSANFTFELFGFFFFLQAGITNAHKNSLMKQLLILSAGRISSHLQIEAPGRHLASAALEVFFDLCWRPDLTRRQPTGEAGGDSNRRVKWEKRVRKRRRKKEL